MILIGSRAIKHWFSDFPRKSKDWDYVHNNLSSEEMWKIGKKCKGQVEFHRNPVFDNFTVDILVPNHLYTLKISHIFWDIKWEKTIFDIVFLKKKGCVLDRHLLEELYSYWLEYHGEPKKSNLTMKTDEFFDNALKEYDHDELHTIINPKPLYTKITVNDGTVATSKELWDELSHENKLELIREECMVMSFERLHDRDYRSAYIWMLKKLILNHLPLYQGLFAVENYNELRLPKYNYVEKINNGLKEVE